MPPVHGLGDGLEERIFGPGRDGLAPADRDQHGLGQRPHLGDIHRVGFAHDLPDPFAAMLAMDEDAKSGGT